MVIGERILIGGDTDVCVHYTFVDGHQHDHFCRVVEDAVAGTSLDGHEAALDAMEYSRARCTVADIVAAFEGWAGRTGDPERRVAGDEVGRPGAYLGLDTQDARRDHEVVTETEVRDIRAGRAWESRSRIRWCRSIEAARRARNSVSAARVRCPARSTRSGRPRPATCSSPCSTAPSSPTRALASPDTSCPLLGGRTCTAQGGVRWSAPSPRRWQRGLFPRSGARVGSFSMLSRRQPVRARRVTPRFRCSVDRPVRLLGARRSPATRATTTSRAVPPGSGTSRWRPRPTGLRPGRAPRT